MFRVRRQWTTLASAGMTVAAVLLLVLPPLNRPDVDLLVVAYEGSGPAVEGPLNVYHLGHSLVGRDIPAMLAQLAPAGHTYALQLGWGTSLREHWEPDLPIKGFDAENANPHFRPAREAAESGDFDAFVLTEMIAIEDAILYHESEKYLNLWADAARNANPETTVYLYETWHRLDDPAGWLERLDTDLVKHWVAHLKYPDLERNGAERAVRLIPAGQVFAAVTRKIESTPGGIGGLTSRKDFFGVTQDGTRDAIHINDIGEYLVALTHYAVLYRRSPVGLPYQLQTADGTPAEAPSPEAARMLQESVWDVVTSLRMTGVSK